MTNGTNQKAAESTHLEFGKGEFRIVSKERGRAAMGENETSLKVGREERLQDVAPRCRTARSEKVSWEGVCAPSLKWPC